MSTRIANILVLKAFSCKTGVVHSCFLLALEVVLGLISREENERPLRPGLGCF